MIGFKQNEPRIFKSPHYLKSKLRGFDDWIAENNYPYKTFSRLAQYLKINRETLLNYTQGYHETQHMDEEEKAIYDLCRCYLREACQDVESGYEDLLYGRETNKGAEFTLKNNFSWRDKQEVTQDSTLKVTMAGDAADYSK